MFMNFCKQVVIYTEFQLKLTHTKQNKSHGCFNCSSWLCNSLQRIQEVNIKYFCSPDPEPNALHSGSDASYDTEIQWEKAEKPYSRHLVQFNIF